MHRIKQIPLFSNLSFSYIDKLQKISTVKSFNKDEILFYEGDSPIYMHILLEGSLRLYKTNSKGNQIFLHQFKPVCLVAELANFEGISYPATAQFLTKGEVLKIDYKKLENDFFKNPEISLQIIRSLTNKLKIMSDVVTNEVILTSEAKIAKFIIENSELFGKLKNTQIASILNLTPETLSRTLTKFKNMGIILESDRHKIVVINEKELLKLYT